MNEETVGIARRFVACPGWAFLPGMAALGISGMTVFGRIRVDQHVPPGSLLPDLDDPVTAAGILPVVRRARNEPNGSLMPVIMQNGNVETVAYYPMVEGLRPFYAKSEILALLAALEGAQ